MKRIDLASARNRLLAAWLVGSILTTSLHLPGVIMGKYEPETTTAVTWLIPGIFPTLGLMFGVTGAVAFLRRNSKINPTLDRSFYRAVLTFTIFYFALLIGTILMEPLSGMGRGMVYLSKSHSWLGPTQAILQGGLAFLFTTGSVNKEP